MNKTIVVSVDGLRSADFANPRIRLPALRGLGAKGISALAVQSIFPSVTWAIHPSVLAGRSPRATGCLGNTLYDRQAGRLVQGHDPLAFTFDKDTGCANLFDSLAGRGLRVGAVCWPLSQGAASLAWNVPEFYVQSHFEEWSTPQLVKELRDLGLPFGRYAPWSASHLLNPLQDSLTLDIARHLLSQDRVDALFVHFLLVDSLQHDFGVGSDEAIWAMEYVDSLVGDLVEAAGPANILCFSDHGHESVHQAFHIDRFLADRGLGGHPGSKVVAASNGGACYLYLDSSQDAQALRRLLEPQEAVAAVWDSGSFDDLGLPSTDLSGRGLLPDLVLEASPDWYFATGGESGIVVGPGAMKSMHGYRPDRPGLEAFVVAAGPDFPLGLNLDKASLLDIAPTLNAIYHLGMADLEGRDIRDGGSFAP